MSLAEASARLRGVGRVTFYWAFPRIYGKTLAAIEHENAVDTLRVVAGADADDLLDAADRMFAATSATLSLADRTACVRAVTNCYSEHGRVPL